MRNQAFYWKCDCPRSVENKRSTYFSDKHTLETSRIAREIVRDFIGDPPSVFTCLKVDGNHFVYRFKKDEKEFLLRTDDGRIDDDYMLAESAVIELLTRQRFPVPKIYATNVETGSVRYQIMEYLDSPTLQSWALTKQLDSVAIAKQFGFHLSRLHQIKLPGFGFIDTEKLGAESRIVGIDDRWEDYFTKCLERHLSYLRDKELLTVGLIRRVESIFEKFSVFLDLAQGSLLHRDFAFWNILGTPREIRAVIDWDDTVIGDPADDISVVNCFNAPEFMDHLLAAYNDIIPIDGVFRAKIEFYTLRNMLWKIMIRHYMGYFEKGGDFFLSQNESGQSLFDYSMRKIQRAIKKLEEE